MSQVLTRTESVQVKKPSAEAEPALTRVNPHLASKLQELGATRLARCYNCGTCTAICPLSREKVEFPRSLLRYAILGAEEKLLSSPAIWLCYFCGECSDNCPKDADPSEFMMAVRRYAMERYSAGRIASVFYESLVSSVVALVVLTLVALLGVLSMKGSPIFSPPNLQSLFSFQIIHDIGLWLGALVILSVLANIAIMTRYVHMKADKKIPVFARGKIWLTTLVNAVVRDSLAQLDYLKCTNKNRYTAHMALFWGFVGLAIATSVDFILGLGKTPLYPIPPQRVLGILSGLVLTGGATYYLYKRLRKSERHARSSHFTDWVFVVLIFLAGISGLLLTLSLYTSATLAAYSLYVVHLVIVFDLVAMAPFTKFAHALYRPLAIWLNQVAIGYNKFTARGAT
jgi:ferredoxin